MLYGYATIFEGQQASEKELAILEVPELLDERFGGVYTDSFRDVAPAWNERPAGSVLMSRLVRGDMVIITDWKDMFRGAEEAGKAVTLFRGLGIDLHCLQVDAHPRSPEYHDKVTELEQVSGVRSHYGAVVKKLSIEEARRTGGIISSHPPLGWQHKNGKCVPCREEVKQCRDIYDYINKEGLTNHAAYRVAIAEQWKRKSTGRKIGKKTIARIIKAVESGFPDHSGRKLADYNVSSRTQEHDSFMNP